MEIYTICRHIRLKYNGQRPVSDHKTRMNEGKIPSPISVLREVLGVASASKPILRTKF